MKKIGLLTNVGQFRVGNRVFHIKDLGPLTRETRVRHGHTLEFVAQQAGISVPSLSRLETGKTLPHSSTMHALIRYVFGDQPVQYTEQEMSADVRQAGLRTLVGNILEQEGLQSQDREAILDVLERLVAYSRSRSARGVYKKPRKQKAEK
jgi:transcriptional regulator with XRE-family HTH domain